MTHRQRVEAVLAGRQADHPPVSFWRHFPPDQAIGQPAVEAHLRFLADYDLDFLKIMNDHPYPRGQLDVLRTVDDLHKISRLPGDAGGFAGQLEVIRSLRRRLGNDVLTCTTAFNAWTVLRQFTAPPAARHSPPRLDGADERDDVLTKLLHADRSAFKAALEAVGDTLAAFARACLDAGADGLFLAVRDDWVDRPENRPDCYDELVRPLDLKILAAVAKAPFNVLHVCGRPVNFDAFAAYPVAAVNWADRTAGPGIADACRIAPAIAAGVDNLGTLPKGTPTDCAREVRDAMRQAGIHPIIIAPGCTFDPNAVPAENLRAIVAAARS